MSIDKAKTHKRNGEVIPSSELGIRNFTPEEIRLQKEYLKKNKLKVYVRKDSIMPETRKNSKKIKIIEL